MIRHAAPKDLYDLCCLGKRFTEESGLGFTWNDEGARQVVWEMLHSDGIFLLAIEGDVIAGMVYGELERGMFKETLAYVTKFFVEKELRRLGVADELVEAFDREAKARGAVISFAASTAAMGEHMTRAYERLFQKHGYTILGSVLDKRL